MSTNFLDTYFFDPLSALKEAKMNNKVQSNTMTIGTQICYYAGKKLKKAPRNCINIPLEKVYGYFRDTDNRIPESISYANTHFSAKEQNILSQRIIQIINQSILEQQNLIVKYKKKIKTNKPDFKEKKWRIFVPASRLTTVMKNVSRHIATSFEKIGYEVIFFIEENDMKHSSLLAQLKAQYKCNPHITINLNHFNNEYLHKKVFNIIWMQDPMNSIIDSSSSITARKRDIIYSIAFPIDYALRKKNLPFSRQNFAINKKIYKKDKKIKRRKKIVFVGSSYLLNLQKDTPVELFNEVLYMFKNGLDFDESTIKQLARKYNQEFIYVIIRVINFIIRDYSVLELCKLDTDYEIEIYGWGWDKYPEIKPYFKGALKYGKDIANVFNSATYSLSPHSCSLLQQRVLEAAACGCIPIVYDCRSIEKHPFFEDNLIFYKKLNTLNTILKNSPSKKLKKIINENSYKKLVNRIIKDVKEISK